jgi:hypothetical protein
MLFVVDHFESVILMAFARNGKYSGAYSIEKTIGSALLSDRENGEEEIVLPTSFQVPRSQNESVYLVFD